MTEITKEKKKKKIKIEPLPHKPTPKLKKLKHKKEKKPDILSSIGKAIGKALESGTNKPEIIERRKAEEAMGIKRGPGAWSGRWEHQKFNKKKKK